MVLDSTMASPAASRQALLCMWTITLTICGFIEHLYLWVYIVRTLVIGARSPKGPQAPPTGAAPSMMPDDPLHTEGAINSVLQKERGKSKCGCLLQ